MFSKDVASLFESDLSLLTLSLIDSCDDEDDEEEDEGFEDEDRDDGFDEEDDDDEDDEEDPKIEEEEDEVLSVGTGPPRGSVLLWLQASWMEENDPRVTMPVGGETERGERGE